MTRVSGGMYPITASLQAERLSWQLGRRLHCYRQDGDMFVPHFAYILFLFFKDGVERLFFFFFSFCLTRTISTLLRERI